VGEGSDLFVLDVASPGTPRNLTNLPGPDRGPPAWSPDGAWIAFLRTDEPKWYAYQLDKLAIVKSDGSSAPRVLTTALDRPLQDPVFTADGASVLALMSDDRTESIVRVNIADGKATVITGGRRIVNAFSAPRSAQARIAALITTFDRPNEVFAVDGANVRQLSHQNDSLFATLQLAPTTDQISKSSDGTEVHSVVVRPVGATGATPMILYIHGGPNGQDNYSFNFARQWFAANGYTVISPNYRGSSGRGAAYQRAIFADWGHLEVLDLMGAVNEAVRSGIADSSKLAIGGWSYGGILTDYSIASTTRFKAAVSGAGSANQLSMYGVDEYVVQYELELGAPWKAKDAWMKVSYPFFNADKIKTPTLFLGGQLDANVPVVGGEQMYQALRTLGIQTELIVYPGQYHGLTVPSFRQDYLVRFVAWCDKFIKPVAAVKPGAPPVSGTN
jgi:dipeptidyl aminopeptidase/acylaminoacyl peptidase